MHKSAKDLTGQQFGRLTAVTPTDKRSSCGEVVWLARCLCGNLIEARSGHMRRGNIKSCGCLNRDQLTTHGETLTKLHRTWRSMKARCYNPNVKCYKYYGGRGIKICDEWLNDYTTFRDWAWTNGYRDDLTIDRIDNDGDYEPNNCRWITKSENSKKGSK